MRARVTSAKKAVASVTSCVAGLRLKREHIEFVGCRNESREMKFIDLDIVALSIETGTPLSYENRMTQTHR